MPALLQSLVLMLCLLASNSLFAQKTYLNRNWTQVHAFPDSVPLRNSCLDPAGNLSLTGNSQVAPGSTAVYTASYNPAGTLRWSHQFTAPYGGQAYGVCTASDAAGNTYVAATAATTAAAGQDIVLLKYSPTGNLLWQYSLDGPAAAADYPVAMALDSLGQPYLLAASGGNGSSADILLLHISASGSLIWQRRYDFAQMDDLPGALALHGNTLTLCGASRTSATSWDYLTLRYDLQGNLLQSARKPGTGASMHCPAALVVDPAGNTFTFGHVPAGIEITKYNSSLAQVWAVTPPLSGPSEATSIALDPAGNLYLTGTVKASGARSHLLFGSWNSAGNQRWLLESPSALNGRFCGQLVHVADSTHIYLLARDEGPAAKHSVLIGYRADGDPFLYKAVSGLPGWPNTPTDIRQAGNYLYLSGLRADAGIARMTTVQFGMFADTEAQVRDSAGRPLHVADQLVVSFAPDRMRKSVVDDPEVTFGDLEDLVDQDLAQEIKARVLGSAALPLRATKVYPRLTTADTVCTSRLGRRVRIPEFWSTLRLHLPSGTDLQRALQRLNDRDSTDRMFPRVRYAAANLLVELQGVVPNDSLYAPIQTSLHPTAISANSHIHAEAAWAQGAIGEDSVHVGVFDTGIFGTHVDFSEARSWAGSKVKGGKDYVIPGNPKISNSPTPDPDGHGTACAGIIGALRNNQDGIAGIAGGDVDDLNNRGASLYAMRVFPGGFNGAASILDIVEAMLDGVLGSSENPQLDIFSNSWAATPFTFLYQGYILEELRRMTRFAHKNEIIVVQARGNAAQNQNSYPATFYPTWQAGDDWVISVGGSTLGGDRIFYSNYGPQTDVIAPADDTLIYTVRHTVDDYTSFSGTSASCPHVSGVAALLQSHASTKLAPEDIEHLIEYGALDKDSVGYDIKTGFGFLHAGNSVSKVLGDCQVMHFEVQPSSNPTQINATTFNTIMHADYDSFPAGPYNFAVYRYEATLNHVLPPGHTIYNEPGKPGYWVRNSASNLWPTIRPNEMIPEADVEFVGIPDEQSATLRGHYYKLRNTVPGDPIIPYTADPNHPLYEPPVMAYSLYVCSPLAAASGQEHEPIRDLFPVPAQERLQLHYQLQITEEVEIELLDLQGRIVKRGHKALRPSGQHVYQFDVAGLAEGMYLCKLKLKSGTWTRKFVIAR